MTLKWKILLILAVAFPYYKIATWKFMVASAVIFFIYHRFHAETYRAKLGVMFPKSQLPGAVGLWLFCAVATEFSIQSLLKNSDITKGSPVLFGLWFLQPLFQSLNEEMLLRSLFLKWLVEHLKLTLTKLNFLMALVFAGLHFLFCTVLYHTNLDPLAGLTIFFATLAMNKMYFKTENILYTWAIHFGINFSFFGGEYARTGAQILNDAEKFNLVYGRPEVVGASLLFLALTTLWVRRT